MGELMRPIGDLDLHLFGEGTHRRLWELLGPQPLHVSNDGTVVGARFATWAPDAEAVFVLGDWNQWTRDPMASVGVSGIWSTVVPAARTGHRYGFEVVAHDGNTVRLPDAMARSTDASPGGHSCVPTSGRHEWTDDVWMHRRASSANDPLRLERVDLEALQRRGIDTWAGVADAVIGTHPDCRQVQVAPTSATTTDAADATMSLLPGLFAPNPSLGEPDGFRRFVDTLHGNGVGVVVEWPPAGGLGRVLARNEARNQLMANALYWLEEFHVDGLRIDARTTDWTSALADAAHATLSVVSEEFPDALVIVD
jgi:1,4-alpha-glucan branching enzyme